MKLKSVNKYIKIEQVPVLKSPKKSTNHIESVLVNSSSQI